MFVKWSWRPPRALVARPLLAFLVLVGCCSGCLNQRVVEAPGVADQNPQQQAMAKFPSQMNQHKQQNNTSPMAANRMNVNEKIAKPSSVARSHDKSHPAEDPLEACYLANNRASESLTISESTPIGSVVGELMVSWIHKWLLSSAYMIFALYPFREWLRACVLFLEGDEMIIWTTNPSPRGIKAHNQPVGHFHCSHYITSSSF